MEEILLARLLILLYIILSGSYLLSRLLHRYKISGILSPILLGILFSILSIKFPTVEEIFGFNFLSNLDLISNLAIIFLLFLAGLDIDIKEMKKVSKQGFFLFLSTNFIPILLIFILGLMFGLSLPVAFTLGLMGAVTAEALLVEILEEKGWINQLSGLLSIEAATLDDLFEILAVLVISILILHTAGFIEILNLLTDILVFVLSVLFVKFLLEYGVYSILGREPKDYEVFMLAISFVFFIAAISIATRLGPAIGALISGIIIKNVLQKERKFKAVEEAIREITFGFLTPIFFFLVGFRFSIGSFDNVLFVFLFISLAFLGKIIGSLIVSRNNKEEALKVGLLLNSRGAMELVVATLALNYGLITKSLYDTVVLMSIITTVLSIFLLDKLFTSE